MRKLRAFYQNFVAWLAHGERPVQIIALAGALLAVDILAVDVHLHFQEAYFSQEFFEYGFNIEMPMQQAPFPTKRFFAHEARFLVPYFRDFYILGLLFLVPALAVSLWRNRSKSRVLAVSAACLALMIAWLPSELIITYPDATSSRLGEDPAVVAYFFKVVLIFLLIISPPFLLRYYEKSTIMDRYLMRSFLSPLLFCFLGFLAIWLIIDLSDNGPDFLDAKTGLIDVGRFYIVQLPQITLLILPVTLLLSVLYCLGKMSRSNEIVTMLGAGRSLGSVLKPLFVFGLYATFVSTVFNYHWAPWSEGHKESILEQIKQGYEQETATINQLHRNNLDHRTWFIGKIPFDAANNSLRTLEIRQQYGQGQLVTTWFANTGRWFSHSGVWRLNRGVIYHYGEDGIPRRIEPFERKEIADWRETPWKLISSSLNPEFLGIPGLSSYLRTNSDHPPTKLAPFHSHWHYRWALPFSCIVVVLVASPLGIVHSRRGVLGGVAACIFIFFSMLFLNSLFLALGQGYRIPAFPAAWTTNLLFAAVGALLFYFRARNRNFPSLNMDSVRNLFPRLAKTPPATQHHPPQSA